MKLHNQTFTAHWLIVNAFNDNVLKGLVEEKSGSTVFYLKRERNYFAQFPASSGGSVMGT